MRINSAREAWHQAYYMPWDSAMAHSLELAQLECAVQKTAKRVNANHAAHQAMAGYIQRAIDTLPRFAQAFGHYLYNPLATNEHREIAEETVFRIAYQSLVQAGGRMTTAKWQKAEFVAKGVLYRYRRMHQGGQSSCEDPLASPEVFRAALFDTYGVALASENWAREWGPFVQTCFDVCNDIDKQALRPVAAVISEMKEAA